MPSRAATLRTAATRVFEVPVVRAPNVELEVREPGRRSRRVPVSGAPIRIGRGAECELVLRDSKVSRRHARLAARDGVLVLTDLGSTNGTLVNGHRVTEVVLGCGRPHRARRDQPRHPGRTDRAGRARVGRAPEPWTPPSSRSGSSG